MLQLYPPYQSIPLSYLIISIAQTTQISPKAPNFPYEKSQCQHYPQIKISLLFNPIYSTLGKILKNTYVNTHSPQKSDLQSITSYHSINSNTNLKNLPQLDEAQNYAVPKAGANHCNISPQISINHNPSNLSSYAQKLPTHTNLHVSISITCTYYIWAIRTVTKKSN